MKKILVVFVAFVFTAVFASTGVLASNPRPWVNVKLPSFSKVVEGDHYYYKSDNTPQYNKTLHTRDSITGGTRAISVQTVEQGGRTSDWISSPEGSIVTWGNVENSNPGTYNLRVKATKSTFASVYYNGIWYLNSSDL